MIDSIEKITLYVKNQKEARDFWTERMGFIVRLEQQMGADKKWLEVGPEIDVYKRQVWEHLRPAWYC